jgi:PhnB protein
MADSQTTYRTVTPYLVVSNADAELAFLKAAFGAIELNCQRRPDKIVMLGQAGGPWKPRSAALYLWVEDVDATYAEALRAGAESESEPEDKPYGHRNAGVIDRNGVTWWIGAPVREKQT